MIKFFALSAAFLFSSMPGLAAPAASSAPVTPPAPLAGIEQQVRCSIVFALVAQLQAKGLAGADRFAPMAAPGKAFFVATGLRVIEDKVVEQAGLQQYYSDRVAKVRADLAAAPAPAAALDREVAQCLPLLAAATTAAPIAKR